jgi:hypothetical protein
MARRLFERLGSFARLIRGEHELKGVAETWHMYEVI